uniref:Uncharacterized protein n=1 Tax=Vitis vinifera TaxID=29760 RepID=F6GZ68_VITVI
MTKFRMIFAISFILYIRSCIEDLSHRFLANR